MTTLGILDLKAGFRTKPKISLKLMSKRNFVSQILL